MSDIQALRTKLNRLEGERDRTASELRREQSNLDSTREQIKDLRDASEVAQAVAKATQDELVYRVTELVSLALEAVFPDPYEFHLDFELKRGRSEARLSLSKGEGEKVDAIDATGGGVVDVAAFALRVALWSLRRPRTRAVLILDEPFRFVSRNLQPRVGELLSEVSGRLGLQIIMVTHEEALIDSADKVFELGKENG